MHGTYSIEMRSAYLRGHPSARVLLRSVCVYVERARAKETVRVRVRETERTSESESESESERAREILNQCKRTCCGTD